MRKAIIGRMEKKNITQRKLAIETGASIGVINKLLTQKKEISFDIVWRILKYLEFENKGVLLSKYTNELTRKNIKYAMEYFSLHGMHNELELLIEKAGNGTDELQEWGRVYSKLQEFQKTMYQLPDPTFILSKLRRLDTTYAELKLIIFLYEMYGVYYVNNFKLLYQCLLSVNKLVLEIDDAFLRICFNARADELLSMVELRLNKNPFGARIYCDRLLDINLSENLNSTAYNVKAYSYIFENFEESIKHFNKSMEYYKRINRQAIVDEIQQEIELAYILWDYETDFSSEYTQTLFKVKNKQINPNELDRFMSVEKEPWIHFFKGIANNDRSMVFASFMKFRKRDDFFLADFPKIELIKMGINEEFINSL